VRRAAAKRFEHEQDRDIVHAWHIAAITLSGFGGKMPDLKVLLEKRSKKGPQGPTQAQMLAQMKMLSAHLGIPLRAGKKDAPKR
jgi:hypothetical protein